MAQVPEKVLSWLYSVLHEYQDPQRTYSDTARSLSVYPSLSPRTEVYTYESGSSALLLTISGTLPVDFRGTTYRFPVKLWIPQAYPQECPIVYVMPGRDMLVRPGQHVGVDGRVYHPYLRDWSGVWDRASTADFLSYLQQAFAKEPPVVSRAQQQQLQRPMGNQQQQQIPGSSPAPPILPPKQRPGSFAPVEMPITSTPPPKPPKPGSEYAPRVSSRNANRDGPPPPLLPGQNPQYTPSPQRYQNGYNAPLQNQPQHVNHHSGRPMGQPPLPSLPQHVQHQQYRSTHDRSPVSPVSPSHGFPAMQGNRYSQVPPLQQPQQYQQQPRQQYPPQQQQPQGQAYQQYPPQQPYPQQHSSQQSLQRQHPPQHIPTKPQPPPDLLSDPFEVTLSGSSTSRIPAPAPPIPPNPEREHLLHALSQTLVQQAQQKVSQNLSAIPSLQAQHSALLASHARLEAESNQLSSLSQSLASNESILHRSIADCDKQIAAAKTKPQPPIDEVLVANSLVAQQLWQLCAEEAAVREAMYVLQKAVDRGRIGGAEFVKQMRGLGREGFLKMALIKKCARGLGLEV